MKITKEKLEKLKIQGDTKVISFSKLDNFKAPDSPPPEPEKEDDDPNAPNKFDSLMRAACSIKTAQLEQQRRKFELLPKFLQAGVYYTHRHEVTRNQESFDLKLYTFQLINKDANHEFAMGKYDRACRRYEEALG